MNPINTFFVSVWVVVRRKVAASAQHSAWDMVVDRVYHQVDWALLGHFS